MQSGRVGIQTHNPLRRGDWGAKPCLRCRKLSPAARAAKTWAVRAREGATGKGSSPFVHLPKGLLSAPADLSAMRDAWGATFTEGKP